MLLNFHEDGHALHIQILYCGSLLCNLQERVYRPVEDVQITYLITIVGDF